MENHPIPQDVTGFKFKLIGSVTVKQFLYLLGTGILAVVVFILPFPFLVRLPFMLIFASIGIGLAFVPIDGRPMDTMITNFAKAIPAENRYIYRKKGVTIPAFEFIRVAPKPKTPQQLRENPSEATDDRKALFLKQLQKTYAKPDKKELELLNNIKGFFEESAINRDVPRANADEVPVSQIKLVKPAPRPKEEPEEEQAQDIVTKEAQAPANVQSAMSEEEKNKETNTQIKSRVAETVQGQSKPEPTPNPQSARFVSPQAQVQAGFPTLPDVPNIIMGIVKDPRGKILQNILVEVLDQNNIPVRAFKTNALGQFASVTPLPNGEYKLYFEDPQKRNEFETIGVSMNGEIFNPIEIFSTDNREKLRLELFGNTAPKASTPPVTA